MASALSNRQNCARTRKTLQTQRGRTHGAGCVRQRFRTAEPPGERRYENWNTHTLCQKKKKWTDARRPVPRLWTRSAEVRGGEHVRRKGTQQQFVKKKKKIGRTRGAQYRGYDVPLRFVGGGGTLLGEWEHNKKKKYIYRYIYISVKRRVDLHAVNIFYFQN